jgi:poly [ADP-ribose] polymerase
MAMLGNGTLAHATEEFEKKFKGKSGLNWEDRGGDPKKGKCECARAENVWTPH